jgi:transcriptional regulator with XRE-family HTH domain
MPHPIDVHVGQRLRLVRKLSKRSQSKLGNAVGLTFQQIQKYEKGTNRIGASRLFEFSQIFDVPVSFFFDDMPPETAGEPIRLASDIDAFDMPESKEAASTYTNLSSPDTRDAFRVLSKAISRLGNERLTKTEF